MFAFMWWMVIGLVAGLLARLFIPGRQPMGWLMTMVLGMAGSLVGGYINSVIVGYDPQDTTIHGGGLLVSIGGAMILLALYVAFNRNNRIDSRI